MSEAKKPREMSAKRFATAKLSGKTTAEGFLAANAAFLRGHSFLAPILDAYDGRQLLPTITLQTVQSALMSHVLESEIKSAQAKMSKGASGGVRKPRGDLSSEPKAYSITLMCKVYNKELTEFKIEVGTINQIVGYRIRTDKGDTVVKTRDEAEGHVVLETLREVKPAVWEMDDYGSAQRLADRRLFQREDSVYAIIRNNVGKPIDTTIQRADSIARILRQPKAGATRRTTSSSSSLKWQGKAKQDHASFSRG